MPIMPNKPNMPIMPKKNKVQLKERKEKMTYNKTKRNYLGLVCWFLVACVISLLALIPMILREKKQAKQGNFPI